MIYLYQQKHQKVYKLLFILILLTLSQTQQRNNDCISYINHFQIINRTQVAQQFSFSGKSLNDLGFPSVCQNSETLNYYTAHIEAYQSSSDFTYDLLFGICITNKCSQENLNEIGEVLVENKNITIRSLTVESITFKKTDFNIHYSAAAICFTILFFIWLALTMVSPIHYYVRICLKKQVESNPRNSLVLTYENNNISLSEDDQYSKFGEDQYSKFGEDQKLWLHQISIKQRWQQIFLKEQSMKIVQFSWFRLIALPLIVYSQIFWLHNYTSTNLFDINERISDLLYAKIAYFGYYIPDIFFFMSGYLYSYKLHSLRGQFHKKVIQTGISILKKLFRLYPLYIVVVIIYWTISPAWNAGPLWENYTHNTQVCNSTAWKSFLLFGNWFNDECYSPAWFVSAQFQFTLIISAIYLIHLQNKIVGYIFLGIATITSFILLFIFSAKLPYDIKTTISDQSSLYFRSSHSHLLFYLTGAIFAILILKQYIRSAIQLIFVNTRIIYFISQALSMSILLLILIRPSIWQAAEAQLSLCRIGILICFIILFLPGLLLKKMRTTVLHKIASFTYPMILCSGLITMSSFWATQNIPYLSAINLLNFFIPNLFLTVVMGLVLGMLFDFSNKFTKKI